MQTSAARRIPIGTRSRLGGCVGVVGLMQSGGMKNRLSGGIFPSKGLA